MSVQIALMAAQAGLGIAQAASSATKGMAAAGAAKDQGILADRIKASQAMAAAAGTGVEIAETRLQTQQQEIARRRQIAQLWQANAIDAVGRGAAPGGGTDSVGVAQAYNQSLGDQDIANIQFMGDSRVSKLSFRKKQLELGASAADLDALNVAANADRRADAISSNMIFQIGGSLLGAAGKGYDFYSSGSGSGYTTNADMKRTDAEIADWSSYGSR